MGTEEIDKQVFRKFEIQSKLGKGVSGDINLDGLCCVFCYIPSSIRGLSTGIRCGGGGNARSSSRVLFWAMAHGPQCRAFTTEDAH